MFGLWGEVIQSRGRLKNTWKEVINNDLKSFQLHETDALVHKKWRKLIRGKQSRSDNESGDSGLTDLVPARRGRPWTLNEFVFLCSLK